jgi:uncharacterized protein (TIGR02453 family)
VCEFQAFPAAGIRFLAALKKNNKREWFQPRKPEFDELVHAPLLQLAETINAMLEKTSRDYAFLDARKALNRIYRDIRFSADKTPYQDHVSLLFPHQKLGKKVGAAVYVSLSSSEAMVAGGMFWGETSHLQAVREHLAAKHAEFLKILRSKPLQQTFGELSGESLQKTPKQFGADHPAADLLKRKQWLLMTRWPAKRATETDFGPETVKAVKLLLPFVQFLNAPLQALTAKTHEPML